MNTIDALVEALESFKQAKDAIAEWGDYASDYFKKKHNLQADLDDAQKAITNLREALARARAEQAEPFGTFILRDDGTSEFRCTGVPHSPHVCGYKSLYLYTTPPAAPVAKLEPLTKKEMQDVLRKTAESIDAGHIVMTHWEIVARAVEAAHNAKLGATHD